MSLPTGTLLVGGVLRESGRGLRRELVHYYLLLALPDAQLTNMGCTMRAHEGVVAGNMLRAPHGLTLRQLVLRTCQSVHKVKHLTYSVRACPGLQGSLLISQMHVFLKHGGPECSFLVRQLLLADGIAL